jgi:hypothetical protein
MAVQQELQIQTLEQTDLTEVLKRAQTLEVNKISVPEQPADLDALIRAADEVGISREAVIQDLRESLGHPLDGIAAGDRVFAKSADGAFYVATVSQMKEGAATVRFVNGGDHVLSLTDLQGFAILPGQKLEAKFPTWGWLSVEVEKYDTQTELVTVTDGLKSKTFPLTEVRLPVRKSQKERAITALLWRASLIAAGVGGAIGALLMRFFGG